MIDAGDAATVRGPNEPLRCGVDLGGTNLQAAVFPAGGLVPLARAHRAHASDEADGGSTASEAVADRIVRAIDEACAAAGIVRARLERIGIAAAGAIDAAGEIVIEAPNLGWRDVPLRALVEARSGRPVVLENDVNAAAWGEWSAAARGPEAVAGDLLAVWVGTGIGGGLVIDGRLFHGRLGTAGELGQVVVDPAAPDGRQRLEHHASRSGMQRRIAEALAAGDRDAADCPLAGLEAREMSTLRLAEAWRAGDRLVERIVESSAELIGTHAANVATLLGLDAVVIGGGMTEAFGEAFVERIRTAFRRAVFPPKHAEAIAVTTTRLGPDAGLVGAALLPGRD